MNLSQDDLQAIQGLIQTTVKPLVDDAIEESDRRTAAGFAEVDKKFARVDERFDRIQADLNRIENKLDVTVDKVDDHEVRLHKLESKAI